MSVTDADFAELSQSGTEEFAVAAPAERILALDVLRGVAVFGICVRNIFLFAMPSSAFALPAAWSAESIANLGSWLMVEVFFDGSMRAIFSMLFGASALIILNNCAGAPNGLAQVERYYRRLLVLIGFGLVHAYLLLWPNDVLFFYGLLGLLLFPLRNLSARRLLALGGAAILILAAMQVQSSLSDVELPLNDAQALTELQPGPEQNLAHDSNPPSEQSTAEPETELDLAEALQSAWQLELDLRQSGYNENRKEAAQLAFEQHTVELYQNHLVDIGAMLLIGMALFKFGFLTGQTSTRIYLCVMLAGYALGIALKIAPLNGWFEVLPQPYAEWEWGTINYDFSRLAIALGHLSVLMLLMRLRLFSMVARLLSGSGRLALTNYLTQTLVGAFVFYGFGFGMFGQFDHGEVLALGVLFGVLQVFFANIYLRYYRQGPFEFLVRVLVNGPRFQRAARPI